MLGVIVEITVKLLPKPASARALLAAFDSVEEAGATVGNIIAEGIIPGGLEMMDNPAIELPRILFTLDIRWMQRRYSSASWMAPLREVADQIDQVNGVLTHCGATEVRVSEDEAERMRFWAGRKAAFPAVGRISPDYYCMDGTIPRRERRMCLSVSSKRRLNMACAL